MEKQSQENKDSRKIPFKTYEERLDNYNRVRNKIFGEKNKKLEKI